MIDLYNTISAISEGTYSELRSKFLAFAIPVRTADEAMERVSEYQKQFFDARHVCWAYRLGPEGAEYRSNDNGEPSGTAGKPILGQMVSAGLSDLLVVVVRYFGGVKLGTSGLILAYRTAAAEAISAATVIERTVDEDVTVEFCYEQMNLVMKVVKDMELKIVDQQYLGNSVSMTVRMRISQVETFRSRFVHNGQLLVNFP